MGIPIIIVCYNNWKYVKNTIDQIININPGYTNDICILDNASSDADTIQYLGSISHKIIKNNTNRGPRISSSDNSHIYDSLPNKFVLTDPDLQLNKDIPTDFIDQLSALSDELHAYKIGFALDISDHDNMFQESYVKNKSIKLHEEQFWTSPIAHDKYELYAAEIDTTFVVINKCYDGSNRHIRVAGNFTARHLPWYREDGFYTLLERYEFSKNAQWSTIGRVVKAHIENNYLIINKNNSTILIYKDNTDPNQSFWSNIYSNWEPETFKVFETYLQPNKICIDIGGWIGTTCLYAAKRSKHVYVVEADKESLQYLSQNCTVNNKNITVIPHAILDRDNTEVFFGPNKFRNDAKLNDSTSQIYSGTSIPANCYPVMSITIQSLIQKYKIDHNLISLIKVDIEGGEEHILDDLFTIYNTYNIPMYISFHYSWWSNSDLSRFPYLTPAQQSQIKQDPFCSILFV